MSDFIESAKQALGRGMSRVSWEADKLRRANAKQSEVNTLKQDRDQIILDFSNTVLTMYRQGQLTDPKLGQYCERILEIESEMTTKASELEQIRDEIYPGQQEAKASAGRSSSAGSNARSANQSTGTSAGASRSAGSSGITVACPTCGEPVR